MQGNLDLGVTSVGITLGSSGTDVSVSGSPITSSGNITINIPTASATNRGALSSADWSTFNSKQGAITLTTTGTSGASTLVGNTLNIPNYTTDLSGYVTLGTAQTITAQKTFTTSGSSDTMIISHGSGSGFALDVIKAGNGEAIRVTKTSGSGNAMTISGGNFEAPTIVKTGGTSSQFLKADGSVDSSTYLTTGTAASTYLPLAGGTLTGGLNGTSANFSGSVGIGTNTPEGSGLTVASGGILVSLDPGANRKVLELYATSTGAKVSSSYVGASSYGNLELLTSGLARLTIADTGAATFSSSVTAKSLKVENTGTASFLYFNNTSAPASNYIALGSAANEMYFQVNGSDRIVIKDNGQVGIGTASPSSKLSVDGDIKLQSSTATAKSILFSSPASNWGPQDSSIKFTPADGTNAATSLSFNLWDGLTNTIERMRITSGGDVLVNSTAVTYGEKFKVANSGASANTALFYFNGTDNRASIVSRHDGSSGITNREHIIFLNSSGTGVGNIAVNGTLTSFNTTSDYRLKEDLQEFNGLEKVQSIKIYNYQWKGSETRMDGVLAHELAEVLPYAVYGEKDEVDENGNDKMQAVDYSKIVPVLIKAIQEQQEQIDSLKNQIK